MTSKKCKEQNRFLIPSIGTISAILGVCGGFLLSYTHIVADFTRFKQNVIENRGDIAKISDYQQTLRKEVKANAETKMDKAIAWQQISNINERIEYLDRHQRNK